MASREAWPHYGDVHLRPWIAHEDRGASYQRHLSIPERSSRWTLQNRKGNGYFREGRLVARIELSLLQMSKIQIRKVSGAWRYRYVNTYSWRVKENGCFSCFRNEHIILKGTIFNFKASHGPFHGHRLFHGLFHGHQNIVKYEREHKLYTRKDSNSRIGTRIGIGYIRS